MNKEMKEIFFKESTDHLKEMKEILRKLELAEEDIKKCADEAHGMRGISASAGYPKVREQAELIERVMNERFDREKTLDLDTRENIEDAVEMMENLLKKDDKELFQKYMEG